MPSFQSASSVICWQDSRDGRSKTLGKKPHPCILLGSAIFNCSCYKQTDLHNWILADACPSAAICIKGLWWFTRGTITINIQHLNYSVQWHKEKKIVSGSRFSVFFFIPYEHHIYRKESRLISLKTIYHLHHIISTSLYNHSLTTLIERSTDDRSARDSTVCVPPPTPPLHQFCSSLTF